MKRLLLLILISTIIPIYAYDDDSVLVDTIYCEPNPMTGAIYYNMDFHDYYHFPNISFLDIGYAYAQFIGSGIFEFRSFITFDTRPVPNDYIISSATLHLYCCYYWDNNIENIWPQYYSTIYTVNIDHIQYETIASSVFDIGSLTPNVGVLQDSAYVGWVSSPVTESYLDDIEQSREYSQFRLRFPPGHDILLYQGDYVGYSNNPSSHSPSDPHLIVIYHKPV